FNNDAFGDYLIYATWPQYRVFVDGRQDVYGANRMIDYDTVIRVGPEWHKIVDKYRIEWIFFNTNSLLSGHLLKNPGWHLVYADTVAQIFVRRGSVNQRLIEKLPGVKAQNKEESSRAQKSEQPLRNRRFYHTTETPSSRSSEGVYFY